MDTVSGWAKRRRWSVTMDLGYVFCSMSRKQDEPAPKVVNREPIRRNDGDSESDKRARRRMRLMKRLTRGIINYLSC